MAFSKSEVNRAGELVVNQILEVRAADGPLPTTIEKIEEFRAAGEIVDWWRGEHAKPLSAVAANLRQHAAETGRPPVVAQRLKRLPTINGKLLRHPKMKLARMGDIGGVRAIVPNRDAAYQLAERLQKNWTITRFNDYVAEPKADGYRGLHLINQHDGKLIEVQIRTPLQDKWANLIELLSRGVAPGLKFGEGPPGLHRLLTELAPISAGVETGDSSPAELAAKLGEIQAWSVAFWRENDES